MSGDYFGVCPICGANDGFLTVNRRHWVVCNSHRVKWCIGENLFSGWHDDSPEQQAEALHKRLVLVVTGLLRRGDPPSPFAREGWAIAAIRGTIVLRGGWTWRDADRAARLVVHEALRAIGAKRPSWREASTPHFAQADAFRLFERTRCRNCGWKLPPENRTFCGPRCAGSYHEALRRAELAAWAAMLAEGL